MAGFLERFDPVQVRYVGHEWRRVVEMVAKSARAISKVRHRKQLRAWPALDIA
jgi:hypothetical protein